MLVGLSQKVNLLPSPKIGILSLNWAVTEGYQESYMVILCLYSNNNPLTYVLTTTKLDTTGHRCVAKLTKFNFMFNTDWENLT